MADEMSIELEDGELAPSSVVSGPSSAAADVQLRAQLREATTVLRRRGQTDLARLALGLVDADLRDVMWVLTDQVRGGGDFSGDPLLFDAFRHTIRMRLLNLSQEAGYDDDEVGEAFPAMVLEAAQYAARLVQAYDIGDTLGGAVVVPPASAAAVRSLEKQTFRAATTAGAVCHPSTERRSHSTPVPAAKRMVPSHRRWATQSGTPRRSKAQNHGPIGQR